MGALITDSELQLLTSGVNVRSNAIATEMASHMQTSGSVHVSGAAPVFAGATGGANVFTTETVNISGAGFINDVTGGLGGFSSDTGQASCNLGTTALSIANQQTLFTSPNSLGRNQHLNGVSQRPYSIQENFPEARNYSHFNDYEWAGVRS